jgi:hypothetical protein
MVRRLFYGKKRTEAQRRENRTGWAFMAPFGILFAIVFIIPCCVSPFGFFLGITPDFLRTFGFRV